MNQWKKLTGAVGVLVAISMTGITAFASEITQTPAETIAELTGRSAEEIIKERNEGKSYGAIAYEAGVLNEYKEEIFDRKEAWYQQRVKDGLMTKQAGEDAIAALTALAQRHADCDGSQQCAAGDGICLWSSGSEACIQAHDSGACAWSDADGHCLWGHDNGTCTWVDGDGYCLSGHGSDNCLGGRHNGTGNCWSTAGTGTANSGSTGTNGNTSSDGTTANAGTSVDGGNTTVTGHHSSHHYSSQGSTSQVQYRRGHGNGGHHGR